MGPGKGQSCGLEEGAPFGEAAKGRMVDWLRKCQEAWEAEGMSQGGISGQRTKEGPGYVGV